MPEIDFWFSIGSTYTFLTVMRLPEWARERDVTLRWRPFNVRRVMTEQNNIPFANKPEKTAYMWRDIQRRAAKYKLRCALPAPYPISDLPLANQVALRGMSEDWGIPFVRNCYRLWFEDGIEAGSEANLTEALHRADQDPMQILARAQDPETVAELAAETETAADTGVFGAPSFVVRGEVFWGDDRLEDALSWSRLGHVA
ncbi:2-hydroxychromene-2-carboxylate isomerase [Ruegeria sp. 2205SS24-7]|uniref:2-hydroxychromene-2-carboxylate isomerase n=1 Tax=Ruegeria discodermiae TaxID=3064389 RepID=UPI00274215EB|nr:2-hydroxychromene-2-carboxylate isomerase [Ruegeria sp. 2205SS24-7]MDP5216752.1 2-hydroxychromene-2-carboxylate isomerase [Ruegeria sp. 2205SS24-7]